jgi:hypothetical protein
MSPHSMNYPVSHESVKKAFFLVGAAKLAFWTAIATIGLLAVLHFLSPEFDPSWRMVSEYALGQFAWVLSLMFISWGISSWSLATTLRTQVKTLAGKIGLGFLILAGIGQAMASIFDVKDETMHGVAALIGIPSLPIAAMLISYSLKRNTEWTSRRKAILLTANLTWISWLLMTGAVIIMMNGFKEAGVPTGQPVEQLPDGVIAFTGWTNRILIILYCLWTITVARFARKRAEL